MEKTLEEVIKAQGGETSEVGQKGFARWMLENEPTYSAPQWTADCNAYKMRFDPEILKISNRKAMQMKAQRTRTGEERCADIDHHCIECISSGCAIVGLFVGYSVDMGMKRTDLCASRLKDAELTIDWTPTPPRRRPDNIDDRNAAIKESREEANIQKATASGSKAEDTQSSSDELLHLAEDFSPDFSPDWGPI